MDVDMDTTNTFARSLHDIGLAAWFGGSLMGAVGLNGASEEVRDANDRTRVANAGWARWTPVNAAGIAAHLLGGAQLTRANKSRLAGQHGIATTSAVKTGVTIAALGATAYARYLGQKVMDGNEAAGVRQQAVRAMAGAGAGEQADPPAASAVQPNEDTPPEVADAQRKLRIMQWAVPALTGTLLVLNAYMGEQQRPSQVALGTIKRALPDALRKR